MKLINKKIGIFIFFPIFLLAERDGFPQVPITQQSRVTPNLMILEAQVIIKKAETNGYKVYDKNDNLVAYIDDYKDTENAVIINNVEVVDGIHSTEIEIDTNVFIDEINF